MNFRNVNLPERGTGDAHVAGVVRAATSGPAARLLWAAIAIEFDIFCLWIESRLQRAGGVLLLLHAFGHILVFCQIAEAGELAFKSKLNGADRAVAGFAEDHFGLT